MFISLPEAKKRLSEQSSCNLSRSELISVLRTFDSRTSIQKYQIRDLKGKRPMELLEFAMGPSYFRCFHYEKPKERWLSWRMHDNPDRLLNDLKDVTDQATFDAMANQMACTLCQDWGDLNAHGLASRMTHGIAMKVVNLVMKHFVFSEGISEEQRIVLKPLLHVPWDRYTLKPIRSIFNGSIAREHGLQKITPQQGMGYVRDLRIYQLLHAFISDIAMEAGRHRIDFEFLAWDEPHQREIRG